MGQFGQIRSFFGGKWSKLGNFWDQKGRIGQNFGKVEKKNYLKVSKNYFLQVYGQKLGPKCHKFCQFGQNSSNLAKKVKLG